MSVSERIVIVGAGQAGAQTVMSLRQNGFAGRITLIGDEVALPYQRPPLSKAYMKGEVSEERLYFKPASWYEENGVEVLLSQSVTCIDRKCRQIHVARGGVLCDDALAYDFLVLATGARLRPLPVPGADLENVLGLRGLADVELIRPQLVTGRRLVIVGAGYIGLEVAAVARQLGLEVTVLEMAERVLARVTSPVISTFYQDLHRAHGVDIRLGVRLDRLRGEKGVVTHAILADGETIEADLVIAGIGILPNSELAEAAGLTCRNGIVVDADARTDDPRIFAAGDCTVRPLTHYARTGRLESVHNAIEQGKMVAAAIMRLPRPAIDCPWFWSDQYDVKLQIAGLSDGYDRIVVRGDIEARRFAAFYLRQSRIIAVDAVNSPAEFVVAKRLIVTGASIDPERLKDIGISMKTFSAEATDAA